MRISHQLVRTVAFTLLFIAVVFLQEGHAQQVSPVKKSKQAPTASADDGKKTFESICATCHGLDGRGGERGPNIATRPDMLRRSDGELLRTLENGVPAAGMPPFQYLGPAKLHAVLQHLRTLQGKGGTRTVPGNAQRGKILFSGKGGCAECHIVSGSGGFLGPDLSLYASTLSVDEIRTAIVSPSKNLDPRMRPVTATTQDGKKFFGLARNEDNFSLQLQTTDGAFHFFKKSDIANLERQQKSLMPDDYGTRLSRAELDDVISYLIQSARATKQSDSPEDEKYEDDD